MDYILQNRQRCQRRDISRSSCERSLRHAPKRTWPVETVHPRQMLRLLLWQLNATAASQYRAQYVVLLVPYVELVIACNKERGVGSCSPCGNVRLKEGEKCLHQPLLLGDAIRAKKEEAEGHDVVELIPEGGGVVM